MENLRENNQRSQQIDYFRKQKSPLQMLGWTPNAPLILSAVNVGCKYIHITRAKNIVFRLPGSEMFSSHAIVGTEGLPFFANYVISGSNVV